MADNKEIRLRKPGDMQRREELAKRTVKQKQVRNKSRGKEEQYDEDEIRQLDAEERRRADVGITGDMGDVADEVVERELSEKEKQNEELIEFLKTTFLGKILYEQDENGNYIPGDYEIDQKTLERRFIPNPNSKNHKEVETITDVGFDGNNVYIQDNLVDRYRLNDPELDPRIKQGLPPLTVRETDVEQLGKQIANRMGRAWNPSAPIMDVEIGHLRSNFMDRSVAPYGVTMAIRVSRASLALRDVSQMADQEVADLLEVFMRCGLNLLISGPTGTVTKNRYRKHAVRIE